MTANDLSRQTLNTVKLSCDLASAGLACSVKNHSAPLTDSVGMPTVRPATGPTFMQNSPLRRRCLIVTALPNPRAASCQVYSSTILLLVAGSRHSTFICSRPSLSIFCYFFQFLILCWRCKVSHVAFSFHCMLSPSFALQSCPVIKLHCTCPNHQPCSKPNKNRSGGPLKESGDTPGTKTAPEYREH